MWGVVKTPVVHARGKTRMCALTNAILSVCLMTGQSTPFDERGSPV